MKPLNSIARRDSGIALIIVMICITVLGGLAALFAFSMKVETRLAMNYNAEDELLEIAEDRIGKALAYYAAPRDVNEPWDALNQTWAGGPGSSMNTNGGPPFPENTIAIDMESRANINMADQMLLDQAMRVMNIDPADSGPVTAAILDWIDPDRNEHIGGAETDYYESLTPSYKCKDGPVDDMSELGLVRGITENIHILWGVERNDDPSGNQSKLGFQQSAQASARTPGLADLFSPLSSGQVNIHTASDEVIAMILNGDKAAADRVIAIRRGEDGMDGTDDDVPMREARDILANAQIPTQLINQVGRYFTTRSRLFQVEVHAKANNSERYFYALIDRDAKKVLTFFWKDKRLDSFNRIAKNAAPR